MLKYKRKFVYFHRTDQRFTCEWTAKDFSTDEPIRKTFQVTFCSMPALQEFERIFQNVSFNWKLRSEACTVTESDHFVPYLHSVQIVKNSLQLKWFQYDFIFKNNDFNTAVFMIM